MTRESESPLRAQPDSRILGHDAEQQQGLFDGPSVRDDEQLLADYRQRYGLAEDPFAHDYSFPLFTGAGRRQVLDQLLHLAQFSNSLLVVLGEYGVGKTRLAHAFMDSLSETDLLSYMSVQQGQSLESILAAIIQSFDLPCEDLSSAERMLACLELFIEQHPDADADGLAVVVLDNAHLLGDLSISALTSLLQSFPQQNRFHLVLVGEPILMSRVERLVPEELLINDFFLPAFNLAESVDYLNFRMEMADYLGPEIFTEAIVDPWWRQSQGQLSGLHEAAQERLLESVTPKQTAQQLKRPLPVMHIVAVAVLLTIVGVVFLYTGNDESSVTPSNMTAPTAANLAQPTVPPAATQAQVASVPANTAATSASALTSTDTPVQPLLQSLPAQPSATSGQAIASASAQDEKINETPKDVPAQEATTPAATASTTTVSAVTAATAPAATTSVPENSVPVREAPAVASATAEPVAKPKAAAKVTATNAIGQEQQILNWKATEYTIQLLGVSYYKAALDFVAAQPNKKDLLIFKSKRQGKDWFVVIAGRFASNAQARQAIAQLPAKQRNAGPWPRDVKTIQQEIRAAL